MNYVMLIFQEILRSNISNKLNVSSLLGETIRFPPVGLSIICGLNLSLILTLALRGFFSGYSTFPSPQKSTFLNSNLIWRVSPFDHLIMELSTIQIYKI